MDDLIGAIERALGEVHQLERTVSRYEDKSQLLLYDRINNLVKELSNIQTTADDCNAHIPLEVVRFVDDGRNPDEFTKDFLTGCLERNEATRGKVEAFKALRKQLAEEVDSAFPDEMEAFRDIRSTSLEMTRDSLKEKFSNNMRNGSVEGTKNTKIKEEPQDEGEDVDMS